MTDESRHDQTLKRVQLWIGVLVGVVTLVVGASWIKKIGTPSSSEEKSPK